MNRAEDDSDDEVDWDGQWHDSSVTHSNGTISKGRPNRPLVGIQPPPNRPATGAQGSENGSVSGPFARLRNRGEPRFHRRLYPSTDPLQYIAQASPRTKRRHKQLQSFHLSQLRFPVGYGLGVKPLSQVI